MLMARPLRIQYPNAVYHVTCRGNERQVIFRDDADRKRFLEILTQSLTIYTVNDCGILRTDTLFERISGSKCGTGEQGMSEVKRYFDQRSGDPVVVANNHYARGAYWLTWDIELRIGEAEIMDQASWDKFDDYLSGKYFKGLLFKERNDIPFSSLSVWYVPGLDHKAHFKGMDTYKGYFTSTTDDYISKFVAKLKTLGEFDNKIFIIVADHGMTAMPIFGKVTLYPGTEDERDVTPDTSCKLTVEKFNKRNVQDSEKTNNNLHIWELGEMMKAVGVNGWGEYQILAPKEIAALYKVPNEEGQIIELPYGATDSLEKANVIAALNGPLAHLYMKGTNGWKSNLDMSKVAELAGLLNAYFAENGLDLKKADRDRFKRLLSSLDTILIRDGGVYKIFKGVKIDAAGNVTGPETELINENTFDANKYVTALKRITGLNNPDRSGDLVFIFKDSTNDISENRYTSGVACKSWHGSLNPSDSYVPLIAAYPGGNKSELEPTINIVCLQNKCEGNWKVTDIILEMIKKQYSGN